MNKSNEWLDASMISLNDYLSWVDNKDKATKILEELWLNEERIKEILEEYYPENKKD